MVVQPLCIRLVENSLYLEFSFYYIALCLRRYPSGKTTESILQSHIGQCARTVCWFAFRNTSACDNTYNHHRPRKTTMGCPYIPLSTSNQVVLGCQAYARNHLKAHSDDRVLSRTTTVPLYFTLSWPAYHSYRSHIQDTHTTLHLLPLFGPLLFLVGRLFSHVRSLAPIASAAVLLYNSSLPLRIMCWRPYASSNALVRIYKGIATCTPEYHTYSDTTMMLISPWPIWASKASKQPQWYRP